MRVPDEVRKTVGYVAYQDQTNGQIVPVGSMFFLGHDPKEGSDTSPTMYAVTAAHVIDQLRKKGVKETLLRLNSAIATDPLLTIPVAIDSWFSLPPDKNIDVAIFEMGIPKNADHLVIPMKMSATKKIFSDHEVELGDEVFISGLFKHHFGTKRNIPIVRTGNLAALTEEKVTTKTHGDIDAYLVEARSIGGISGSPVFLNLGFVRHIGGEVKHVTGARTLIFLLGLVHGHFEENGEELNAGIAIVVPIESIHSCISDYEKSQKKS